MSAEATFRQIAPAYMARLLVDFPTLNKLDAAAVFGNAGYESGGFTKLQEISPIAGRGGFGWFQWTGPRRRSFETYAKRNNLALSDADTNYKFLFVELKGEEARAISALRAKTTLEDKVVAFEQAYERAGVKNYPERQRWARIALDAFEAATGKPAQPVSPPPAPEVPSKPETPPTSFLAALIDLVLSLLKGLRK